MAMKPGILVETESNPVPALAAAGHFTSGAGVRIRYGVFDAEARPCRGTVIVLQGRNECIEKYFETARDLSARGFQTATFDWRGQGGSDRLLGDPKRGHVASFADYVEDFERFVDDVVLPDCRGPYYILGHSTGSLVALLAAPGMKNRIERLVLCSPLLRLHERYPTHGFIGSVSAFMNSIGLGAFSVRGASGRRPFQPFDGNRLTSDPFRFDRNQSLSRAAPHLFLGGPTASWLHAFYRASDQVNDPDHLAAIQIPALIVSAGIDQVVSNRAIHDFAARLRGGAHLTIHGARHEILQEADLFREQFFAAFDAFVPGSATLA
jgi:lysophospholipase